MEIRHSLELEAPLAIAYDLCRQLEDLPRLLPALQEVTPEEPNGIRYRVVVGDEHRALGFDAELTDATPDRRLAWRHLDGPIESAAIDFVPVSSWVTRLEVALVPREDAEAVEIDPLLAEVGAQFLMLRTFLADLSPAPRRSPAVATRAA